MVSNYIACSFLLPILVIVITYYYNVKDVSSIQLKPVLDGLLLIEDSITSRESFRVAVGFGSCVDILVDGVKLMETLPIDVPAKLENFNEIRNIDEFANTFGYFLSHGASAGRRTINESMFEDLITKAKQLNSTRQSLGGNAVIMTKRFAKEGVSVLLGAHVTENLRQELQSKVSVIEDGATNGNEHLILEYERGARWQHLTAPRANRFIIHHDRGSPLKSLLPDFASQMKSFNPSLLVVGGLRMMINPLAEDQGLGELQTFLSSVAPDIRIHLEMSSFPVAEQLRAIIRHAVYYADSLGMNEQELPNLCSLLLTSSTTLISDPYPRVARTLDHMRQLFSFLHETRMVDGKRPLSRLHVHTLAYQVVMSTGEWLSPKAAAAKASLTANRHTCGSDQVDIKKGRLLMDGSFSLSEKENLGRIWFNQDQPVSCWTERNINFCLAPVIVCTKVLQTVGGGDNISAAALAVQT